MQLKVGQASRLPSQPWGLVRTSGFVPPHEDVRHKGATNCSLGLPSERGRRDACPTLDCIVPAKPERFSCRWGARSSRPLPSASRRRSSNNHLGAPFVEWNLSRHLFGETPHRATGTVALPFFDCRVPAKAARLASATSARRR